MYAIATQSNASVAAAAPQRKPGSFRTTPMTLAEHIHNRRKSAPIGTIVHIGAHHGQEIGDYETLLPKKVVWVDAVADHNKVLEEQIASLPSHRRPCHLVLNALVTDRVGDTHDFHVFSNSGASSSIFPSTDALRHRWPELTETGEVRRLTSTTIDSLLRESGISPASVDVLVVDTQGSELLCLKGARECLAAAKFVEVEVSQVSFYEGGVLFLELDEFLSACGFKRRTPVPVHGDVVYERLTYFDHRLELLLQPLSAARKVMGRVRQALRRHLR